MKIKRADAIKVLVSIGVDHACALSTNRLQKKINRLNRVINEDYDSGDEEINDLLDIIWDAFDAGNKVEVLEDRKDLPPKPANATSSNKKRTERKKTTQRKTEAASKKYDWKTIFSGKVVLMEKGVDFDCKPANFGMQVRNMANKREQKVRVKVDGDKVYVQAEV